VKLHFVRDMIFREFVKVVKVSKNYNPSDIIKKVLHDIKLVMNLVALCVLSLKKFVLNQGRDL